MMRFIRGGDIFASKAQVLVNTVNCVGVMGKGLAKAFRHRFPEAAKAHIAACRRGEVQSGTLLLYRYLTHTILSFPTKDNWKGKSKYDFIEAGLQTLVANYERWGIMSIAIPPLGCGLGGLEWSKVRAMLVEYLGDLPIEVEVYEPTNAPSQRVGARSRRPVGPKRLTVTQCLVGELIRRLRSRMPETASVGRLLVQKAAFLAQMRGAPLHLRFQAHKYGPYDHNVSHVIDHLEGIFVRDDSPSYRRSSLRILDEERWDTATHEHRSMLDDHHGALESAVAFAAELPLPELELVTSYFLAWSILVGSGSTGDADEVRELIDEWKPGKFNQADLERAQALLRERSWTAPPDAFAGEEAGELMRFA